MCTIIDDEGDCGCICLCVIALVVILAPVLVGCMLGFILGVNPSDSDPQISLTVNEFTGLSQNKSSNTISPLFNFTVSLKVHKYARMIPLKFCYEQGIVTVLYQRTPLATGPLGSLCARKDERRESTVFAWGNQVEIPDFLRDQLFEEVRNGDVVVEVDLKILDYSGKTAGVFVCTVKNQTMEVFPCKRTYLEDPYY
ncbi:hypothetical protein LUZ63_014077 [Rhynchospora breviuscula]|uniref:Uncharacterized protein n=1 Tax=Rhynchospora breviuscula TaxID=2022672 RepID=A0A9Q0HKU4_9POAL|nr:hypothetical protein LUZ63_014077 [Rhynchospora breviuscula]